MAGAGDLSSRGWVGVLLGRRLGGCTGQWDVLAEGKIVHSSSVQVDEEHLPWLKQDARQPLRPTSRPRSVDGSQHASPGGQDEPSVSTYSDRDSLCALNLYSGAYSRAEGLSGRLKQFGWKTVIDVDNDPDVSGGWKHDLFNDEFFAKLLALAARGAFDAIMIAFPCSMFSAARLFDSDPPGPPMVRDRDEPDGYSSERLDPKHAAELNRTTELLNRTTQLIIAARNSPKRTTVFIENPADKSIKGTLPYAEDCKMHGSLWATTSFKDLAKTIVDSSMATFAYCRFGSTQRCGIPTRRVPSLTSCPRPPSSATTRSTRRSLAAGCLMGLGPLPPLPPTLHSST